MSELHGTSETTGTASEAAARTRHEASSRQGTADKPGGYPDIAQDGGPGGYSDAAIEAFLAAEEHQPEPRTRQEAATDTWDDGTDDPDSGSEMASGYDGDVDALLAAEQHLPEPRTRQEAAASTWDDTTWPAGDDPRSYSGDPASEYDGDVAALLAEEEHLPEPRTRQEAAAATWDDADTSQETAPDASTDDANPAQPGTATDQPVLDGDGADGTPGPSENQVAVHTTDGTNIPVTVTYLPPEDRTVGDTTPAGIGRKPTGEEFLGMEGDNPAKRPIDSLLKEVTEDANDARDAAANITETVHNFRLPGPGPGSGHAHEVHPVHEPAPPEGPAPGDLFGSAALVGVAILTGIRYGTRHFGKGDAR